MQNDKTLQQMIREYEMNMPPEIMELISKFDWKKELRTIVMQNQLMADVGADLEESVYLMLLGVVKVQDVYERMIETHELSQDRVRKVLEEVEAKIFDVLHKKLAQMEEEEEKTVVLKNPTPIIKPVSSTVITPSATMNDSNDRDAILAEIEKDEIEPIVVKPAVKPVTEIKSEDSKPIVSNPVIAPKIEDNKINIVETPGVAKPFTLNSEKTITNEPKIVVPEITKGIQADPIASGLNKATVMAAPENKTPSAPVTPKTTGAPDPYREPIE